MLFDTSYHFHHLVFEEWHGQHWGVSSFFQPVDACFLSLLTLCSTCISLLFCAELAHMIGFASFWWTNLHYKQTWQLTSVTAMASLKESWELWVGEGNKHSLLEIPGPRSAVLRAGQIHLYLSISICICVCLSPFYLYNKLVRWTAPTSLRKLNGWMGIWKSSNLKV